jgi:hypothetical protein
MVSGVSAGSPLLMRISFRGYRWDFAANDGEGGWKINPESYDVPFGNNAVGWESIEMSIQNKAPKSNIPLYEEAGAGYAVNFEGNTGSGTLKIELMFRSLYDSGAGGYVPTYYWLKNFDFNILDTSKTSGKADVPQTPCYFYPIEKKEPAYTDISTYLMSRWNGPGTVNSFSQVFSDSTGGNLLDKLTYSLPRYGDSNYPDITEKPEEHLLRLIDQLVSGEVSLDYELKNSQVMAIRQAVQDNKLLVRDSSVIDALNDKISIKWKKRMVNYDRDKP